MYFSDICFGFLVFKIIFKSTKFSQNDKNYIACLPENFYIGYWQ